MEELKKQIAEVFINDGVSAVDYAGDGIKTNDISKLVENTARMNIEDVVRIKADIDLTQSKLDRLNSAIGSLEISERQVIILGYIEGYQWQEVAHELSYTARMIRNKKSKALSKLAYIFYGDRVFDIKIEHII